MCILNIIYDWQTLIGSILGGVVALFAALIVAFSVNRREVISSSMTILRDLAAVRVSIEALEKVAAKKMIKSEDYPLWASEKLVQSHHSLSPLFEGSMARLMIIDVVLAAHLSLFYKIYSEIENLLKRLSVDYDHFYKNGKPLRPQDHLVADSHIITNHLKLVIEHVECAEYLITNLILSRISILHRFRRHLWKTKKEKYCLQILEKDSS